MTNYPNAQDNNITLPGVSGVSDEDIAINALRDATFAIEKELGITPSGVYTDIRARFDILEARINNPASGIVLSDGYTNSPFFIVNTPASVTLSISDGYGAPTESRVNGSIYMRADGYANNELYVRRSGAWFPVQSDLWVAGGDLSGTYTSQTVIGIRGKSLNVSLATVGATQDGYHLTWSNSTTSWGAATGFIAGGDLAILSGPFGRTGQTVIRLQGRNLSSVAPGGTTSSDGDALAWDPTTSQWQPRTRAIIFDGYVARTNLRSNKSAQSPIDNTKTGIVNFGSRSAGVTAGTTNDYAAILSGDRNTVGGSYSIVAGGDSHIVNGQYAGILSGLSNTASAQYAVVLGGTNNSATALHTFVVDGYTNTATTQNSFVLNGGNNNASASFSGILNGINNVTGSSTFHSGIGWGTSNTVGNGANYSIVLGGSGNTAFAQYNLIGTANAATINASSNFATILNGSGNTIGATSPFAFILGGNSNTVSASSSYATVLNGNVASVNGLHSTVLNGFTNSVTATYSLIGTGNNNTISGNPAYAAILDGYSNTVTGSGSVIVDGYSNSIAGLYSSIINGNSNTINAPNSTILNGSSNTIDVNSLNNAILFGTSNTLNSTARVVVAGNGNTFTGVTNAYILGQFNNVQGNSTKITGDSNVVGSSSNFNRIFGNSNNLGTSSIQNSIFGASNNIINTSSNSLVLGSNNIVDATNTGIILGGNNIANANFTLLTGQFGKARMYGQQVQANSRFTVGKIGEAQVSKLVLTGIGGAGAAITLQLQDTSATNMTFVDGYSYEMNVRVLVVNTSPISPNPVVPARYIYDVLAHCEAGVLVIDHVNQTLATAQSSGTPWTVSVSGFGLAVPANNQFVIQVDSEAGPPYVQPTNTPSSRRAIATVEMREISRI